MIIQSLNFLDINQGNKRENESSSGMLVRNLASQHNGRPPIVFCRRPAACQACITRLLSMRDVT